MTTYSAPVEVYDWPIEVSEREARTVTLVDVFGDKYGLSDYWKYVSLSVVRCETGGTFDAEIKSKHVGEDSWGLAQIHLPAHLDVTEEEAKNPYFAINFLTSNIMKHPSWWTCYTMLKRKGQL